MPSTDFTLAGTINFTFTPGANTLTGTPDINEMANGTVSIPGIPDAAAAYRRIPDVNAMRSGSFNNRTYIKLLRVDPTSPLDAPVLLNPTTGIADSSQAAIDGIDIAISGNINPSGVYLSLAAIPTNLVITYNPYGAAATKLVHNATYQIWVSPTLPFIDVPVFVDQAVSGNTNPQS